MVVQKSESLAEVPVPLVPVTVESFAALSTETEAESSECQMQT